MSSDEIDIRDARGTTRGVVTHKVLSRNNATVLDDNDDPVTEDTAPRAQVVALGFPQGADGNVDDVSGDAPLPTADYSPPLTPLGDEGLDVTPDTPATLVAANAGRLNVEIIHAGTRGRLWLGFGQAAVAGRGIYLDPGDYYERVTTVAVTGLLTGADWQGNVASTAQRVTGMEWAA